jgi:hypothetical protein
MHVATFWNGKISAELVDIITESNPIPPTKKKLYMIWKLDTGKHGYLKGSHLNRITENNPVTKENNLQQRCTNSFIRNLYTSHIINTTQFSLPLKLNVGQKKTTTTNKQNSSLVDIVKPVKICCW